MASYKLIPSSFKGTILSQPSKSMGHRTVICGAPAKGESTALVEAYSGFWKYYVTSDGKRTDA